MMEFISQPWAWYVAGPLITLVMFLLLYLGGAFGVSSSMRTICAAGGAGKKISFFDFNWRNQIWNLVFVGGAIAGGCIAAVFMKDPSPLQISENTVEALQALGISFNGNLIPTDLFNWARLTTPSGLIIIVIGGFMVGFGARWAGGCTSGHAISGLSNWQIPSLLAVVGFFIGGLLMTHLFLPIILNI